jgi:hypothetical protein
MGLPEFELAQREQLHRGVYCRPGLLIPSDTTLYHLCPAQHFNSLLPLGPERPYTAPGGVPLVACWDAATLLLLAAETCGREPPQRAFYVLQIELDLLISPLQGEDGEAPQRGEGRRVRMAEVNEMAITRVFLARRDRATGQFLNVAPPNGEKGD